MVEDRQLAVLRALIDVSSVDLLYADLYLDRAGTLLPEILSRDDYARVRAERQELPRLIEALRGATERAEWARVEALAAEAIARQAHTVTLGAVLDVADAVYGPRTLRLGPAALGLAGLAPCAEVERERAGLVERLAWLASADPEWHRLYGQRAAAFHVHRGGGGGGNRATMDEQGLRASILDALGRADFGTVRRLVDGAGPGSGNGAGMACRVAPPPFGRARALRAPIPSDVIERAAALGLVPEVLGADSQWEGYLAGETEDAAAAWPALHESLDLLVVRPFMSSGGMRYVPWFGGEETLLVEAFPETEPDGPGPLLDRLGLERRRGLSRLAVEDAVRSHSVALCSEIGLDPFEFTLTVIPFDAYVRLAPRYGWGAQALWTHFDGYQVVSGRRLHALIGGDVRYGGAADLSPCRVITTPWASTLRVVHRARTFRRPRSRAHVARGDRGQTPIMRASCVRMGHRDGGLPPQEC
jgi:hypothetical protein